MGCFEFPSGSRSGPSLSIRGFFTGGAGALGSLLLIRGFFPGGAGALRPSLLTREVFTGGTGVLGSSSLTRGFFIGGVGILESSVSSLVTLARFFEVLFFGAELVVSGFWWGVGRGVALATSG